jgi:1-phosphofructokinase
LASKADDHGRRPRVCVFAPAPLLTVTIETGSGSGTDEIHLHAGGQGFWIARLVAELGVDVVLCGSFGGETGRVARALVTSMIAAAASGSKPLRCRAIR